MGIQEHFLFHNSSLSSPFSSIMAATVAMGELRSKREAMDRLAEEISTSEDANQDSISMSIRDALEV